MRLVIRSRDEMSEGEPCVDTCRDREPLENILPRHERRGGNFTGQAFYMEPEDGFAIVDLDDEWHRAREAPPAETEDLPDDPGRLDNPMDPENDAEAHAALECQIIRERAAELCSAMAAFWAGGDPRSLFAEGGAPSVGTSPIVDLAFNAFMQAHRELEQRGVTGAPTYEVYAEAEALIRCGWEP